MIPAAAVFSDNCCLVLSYLPGCALPIEGRDHNRFLPHFGTAPVRYIVSSRIFHPLQACQKPAPVHIAKSAQISMSQALFRSCFERIPLCEIEKAMEVMDQPDRNKVVIMQE